MWRSTLLLFNVPHLFIRLHELIYPCCLVHVKCRLASSSPLSSSFSEDSIANQGISSLSPHLATLPIAHDSTIYNMP